MKIETLKIVYFSPTGTSKTIAEEIAKGIDAERIEKINITKPEARKIPLNVLKNDLLVFVVPVYVGRVPALLSEYFQAINADKTPAVCVVVYGNREYDNALLELKDILKNRGCLPIAGAAFIGEHSFSSDDTPIAPGRPDIPDMELAREFGKRISEKLKIVPNVNEIQELKIRGDYPYGGINELWDVNFIEVSPDCTDCGICSDVCPTGAVNPENGRIVNIKKCITCCNCIKTCPENARKIKPGQVMDVAIRLSANCQARREPELFF